METIVISFIINFYSDWEYLDKNDYGCRLSTYGKNIYFKNPENFSVYKQLLNNIKDFTDIRPIIIDLIKIDTKNEIKLVLGLIFLALCFNKLRHDIDEQILNQELICIYISYLYPLIDLDNIDIFFQYYEYSNNYKNGLQKLKDLF